MIGRLIPRPAGHRAPLQGLTPRPAGGTEATVGLLLVRVTAVALSGAKEFSKNKSIKTIYDLI